MDANGKKVNRQTQVFHYALICILFVIFVYVRASWFELHYTHYDDIQVAHLTDYTVDHFAINFEHYKVAGGITEGIYDLCYFLFHSVYNWCYYAINFSKYWTYAPMQFVLTFAFLPLAKSYNGVKFFGRLPSLINGIIALFVCWRVLKNLTGSKKAALIGTSVLGFSWQSILYCMHMSNYESIILCGFITMFVLIKYLEEHTDNEKKWALGALLLGVMTWLHYQVLCLFCGYVFTYFVFCIINKMSYKKILYRHVIIGALYGITVLPLLTFANLKSVASWNAGVNGQFLFHFKFDFAYIVSFFVQNFYLVLKAMLSPISLESKSADMFACFYLALIVFGIIKGLKDYKKKNKTFYLTVFNCGVFLSELVFVFLGKFTLSPTRHCNLLIPIFVTQIGVGCYYLFSYIKNELYAFLPYAILCVMCFCFLSGYGQIKGQRIDPFTDEAVGNIVKEYDPDVIVGRHAPQMWYLLDETVYGRRDLVDYRTDFFRKEELQNQEKTILIVSSTTPVDSNIVGEISGELVQQGYLENNEIDQLCGNAECVRLFEQTKNVDFDFYNVGYGGSNNMYCAIYRIR